MDKFKARVGTEVKKTILLIKQAVEDGYMMPSIEEPLT